MSHGPGRYQQMIISILALPSSYEGYPSWWPMGMLAGYLRDISGGQVNRSQLRRAIRALERSGHVDVARYGGHTESAVTLTDHGWQVIRDAGS